MKSANVLLTRDGTAKVAVRHTLCNPVHKLDKLFTAGSNRDIRVVCKHAAHETRRHLDSSISYKTYFKHPIQDHQSMHCVLCVTQDVGFANILSKTHLSNNYAFTFAWAAPEVRRARRLINNAGTAGFASRQSIGCDACAA